MSSKPKTYSQLMDTALGHRPARWDAIRKQQEFEKFAEQEAVERRYRELEHYINELRQLVIKIGNDEFRGQAIDLTAKEALIRACWVYAAENKLKGEP